MSELPQVEVARVVMVRDGEGVDYIAGPADWLSLLDNPAVASILHSAAAELAELADTFGPYGEGTGQPVVRLIADNPDGGVSKVADMAASALAERRKPTDGGDDGEA